MCVQTCVPTLSYIALSTIPAIQMELFVHTAREGKLNCIVKRYLKVSISADVIFSSCTLVRYIAQLGYLHKMVVVSELEELFGKLWTQCQECQGSLHQDVLCTRF